MQLQMWIQCSRDMQIWVRTELSTVCELHIKSPGLLQTSHYESTNPPCSWATGEEGTVTKSMWRSRWGWWQTATSSTPSPLLWALATILWVCCHVSVIIVVVICFEIHHNLAWQPAPFKPQTITKTMLPAMSPLVYCTTIWIGWWSFTLSCCLVSDHVLLTFIALLISSLLQYPYKGIIMASAVMMTLVSRATSQTCIPHRASRWFVCDLYQLVGPNQQGASAVQSPEAQIRHIEMLSMGTVKQRMSLEYYSFKARLSIQTNTYFSLPLPLQLPWYAVLGNVSSW